MHSGQIAILTLVALGALWEPRGIVRVAIAFHFIWLSLETFVALYPDPAYPDSFYYVDVARAIAAGHGLNVDFVWIFAEVGNRLPNPAVLPIPSNAHWLPLASFLQAPFIALFGPTSLASALPGIQRKRHSTTC